MKVPDQLVRCGIIELFYNMHRNKNTIIAIWPIWKRICFIKIQDFTTLHNVDLSIIKERYWEKI